VIKSIITAAAAATKLGVSQTVIDVWNTLPEELLQCRRVDNFKIKFDFFSEKNGDSKKLHFFPMLIVKLS